MTFDYLRLIEISRPGDFIALSIVQNRERIDMIISII